MTKRRVVYEDKKAVSLKLKQDKQLRLQIVKLENRLKREENDTVSCKARVNSLKTQIQVEDMVSCKTRVNLLKPQIQVEIISVA